MWVLDRRPSGDRRLWIITAKRLWLLLLVAVVVAACGANPRRRVRVRVGSGDSAEQMVLGIVTVRALKAAGYRVVDQTGLGSAEQVRAALEAGSIDLCWEYTGDTWLVHLRHDQPISKPGELYQRVREEDARNRIEWVAMAPAERTLGLVMRREAAQENGIVDLSELARHLTRVDPGFRLCTPKEIHGALDGIRGLERYYRLHFDEGATRWLSIEEGYQALVQGECDCAVSHTTDGQIAAQGLYLLEDDRDFFRASSLAAAVRTPVLGELPGLEEVLGEIGELLTQEAVIAINHRVALEGQEPAAAAKALLAKMR